IPKGTVTCHGSSKDHVLTLPAILYHQKQTGCVWNSYLVEKLCSINFQQSLIDDDCVIYCDDIIFTLSVVDADYVGLKISKHISIYIKLTQCALNDSIINDVHFNNACTKLVPAYFNYQSVISKLSYVGQRSHSNILFATHAIAESSSDHQQEHREEFILGMLLQKT
ncbi:hypothetical protein ACHAW6_006150, partial [Cyclotella cf. meneghiniana]